ncbi:MAG: hypothetical protein GQ527_02725, partial [Bacteroidales bacterium]|nr:hypothetical protein [Bacteroidales bacterium]
DHVYNEVDSEIWEYGGEADYNDLLFEFQILNTNMCNEDYRLIHQEDFKNSWYTVLENWRNN